MAINRQTLSFAETVELIYAGLGKMGKDFVPSYEFFSTLLDKIGYTFSLQSEITDHLAIFNDITLPYGTTVEEYINDLLEVKNYDPESTPFGQDVLKVERAYHTRSADKKVELPVFHKQMTRAMQSQSAFSAFFARQMQRIADSKALYKYEGKKVALANKIIRDLTYNFADTTNSVTGKHILINPQAPSVIRSADKGVALPKGDVEDVADLPLTRLVGIPVPADVNTGEDFILAVKQLIGDMKFASRKYNPFGVYQEANKGNLALFIRKGLLPILDVKTIAGAFHQNLLSLDIDIIELDDFGLTEVAKVVTHYDGLAGSVIAGEVESLTDGITKLNDDVYGLLADKRVVRWMETLNETGVDVNNNAQRILYTHHFGETVVTSDAVNFVAIANVEVSGD